jgi:cell division protein FtsW (lipid II flippase)
MERPNGISAIASLFLLAAVYLLGLGCIMLASPGAVPMRLGAPLLSGFELAGPYMFLLVGAAGAIIAAGLWKLQNWARWAAIVAACLGIVLLVPSVSSAVSDLRAGALAWDGLGVMVRVIVIFCLLQSPAVAIFLRRNSGEPQ